MRVEGSCVPFVASQHQDFMEWRENLAPRLKIIILANFINSSKNAFAWKLCSLSSHHISVKASQLSRFEPGQGSMKWVQIYYIFFSLTSVSNMKNFLNHQQSSKLFGR